MHHGVRRGIGDFMGLKILSTIKGVVGIFVEKGHSLGSVTMGVHLLGVCVYYAEYGKPVKRKRMCIEKLYFSPFFLDS